VLEAIPQAEPQRILDLYAGSGLFTVPLAARGHHLTAVEENGLAIDDAEANLRLNRVNPRQVRLHAARVESALQRLRDEVFDCVILDPPRQGCSPEVIRSVFGQIDARQIVYVSCNPEALAAEMPAIAHAGFVVERVQPVDMFPHTAHIETVVTFSRPSPPNTRGSGTARRGSTRPPRPRR
jgi:23S rRNA (uracil1939-C5)-methyltransferase